MFVRPYRALLCLSDTVALELEENILNPVKSDAERELCLLAVMT